MDTFVEQSQASIPSAVIKWLPTEFRGEFETGWDHYFVVVLAKRADRRWTLSSCVMSRAVNGSYAADAYSRCGLTREV